MFGVVFHCATLLLVCFFARMINRDVQISHLHRLCHKNRYLLAEFYTHEYNDDNKDHARDSQTDDKRRVVTRKC